MVALVAAGGTLGTTARYLTTHGLPVAGGWPLGTLTENLLGSLLLGALLEALVRRGVESTRGRIVRLAVGTGFLGGFTTFSSLAIELERLLAAGAVGTALAYAAVSLVGGLLACVGGVLIASRHHTWRQARTLRAQS
jgi:CrcB protein